MKFAHLHTHTMFSKLDSINRPHAMMAHIAELGQTHVAITDHGNLYAFAEVVKAAKKVGVTVLPGVEFYVAVRGMENRDERDTYHLTVFALNRQGYKNLCILHTESFKRGFYYDPRIDLDLLARHSDGLFALSGCLGGALPKAIKRGDLDVARDRLKELHAIFGSNLRIELQDHGIADQKLVNERLRFMSKAYDIPMVATNDAHYTRREDFGDHDIVICLGTGSNVNTPDRKKIYLPFGEHWLKGADDMAERFEPEVIEESQRIAEMFEPFDLFADKGSFHIPEFPVPAGYWDARPSALPAPTGRDALNTYFITEVQKGLVNRYGSPLPAEVTERASRETQLIIDSGFVSYILIVADLYDFMRSRRIPVGAGRGSAAGSIVSYALGITKLDPLKFGLLFERFINPERISMPDIDMDISKARRDEVYEYARQRWGEENVSRIITFQTFGGRKGIRDVGRVLAVPLQTTDRLAKLVPLNGSLTTDRESRHYLQDAIATVSGLKSAYEGDDLTVTRMLESAMFLEGCVTTPSIHAAGVVISDRPLQEYLPMAYIKDSKDRQQFVTSVDMNSLEDMAQIKFDFLGLRTLDAVEEMLRAAKLDGKMPYDFEIDDIPYDDDKTYRMLARGLTAGVFQLESTGMRQWLRQLKPDRVEDVMAMVALYRPGPMEFIPTFVKRKNGEEAISYPHPSLEETLRETYGVVVYQEQIMAIAQIIAGWTLGRADMLRKVIGKKIIEKIEGEKNQFVTDAVKQGHDEAWARDLFEHMIEPAARYSFNKSHACAYGDLSYRTAWLKANYPTYYYAALISSISKSNMKDKAAKIMSYIADARAAGVAILPPDIHESGLDFTPLPDRRAVRFGLQAIKHVGEKAIDLILTERDKGPFVDMFDFISRTRHTLVNARTIKSLILAGALDELGGTRAQRAATVPNAFKRVDELLEDQRRIRDSEKPKRRQKPIPEPVLVDAEMSEDEILGAEHELLGIYVSGHPFMRYAAVADAKSTVTLSGVREMSDGHHGTIAGIVTAVKQHSTKNGGKAMLFATIEDDQVTVEVTVFPRTYADQAPYFELGKMVVLKGKADVNEVETQSDDEDELGEIGAVEVKWISDVAWSIEDAPFVREYDPTAVRVAETVGVRNDLVDRSTVVTDMQPAEFRQVFELTVNNYADTIARIKREHKIQNGDVKVSLPDGSAYYISPEPPFKLPEYW